MSQACLVHLGLYQKMVQCESIKAVNKEVNKVVKGKKSAVEYTCGNNGSANTIQVADTQVLQAPYERFTSKEKA